MTKYNIISTGEVREMAYPRVFVDFKAINALPNLAPSQSVKDAFSGSNPTVTRFLQAYNVKKTNIGRKYFYDKKELIQALKENDAQQIQIMEV